MHGTISKYRIRHQDYSKRMVAAIPARTKTNRTQPLAVGDQRRTSFRRMCSILTETCSILAGPVYPTRLAAMAFGTDDQHERRKCHSSQLEVPVTTGSRSVETSHHIRGLTSVNILDAPDTNRPSHALHVDFQNLGSRKHLQQPVESDRNDRFRAASTASST